MKVFEVVIEDTRTSILNEPISLIVPTVQKLNKVWKLFGIIIYSKVINYKDDISIFESKATKEVRGFK